MAADKFAQIAFEGRSPSKDGLVKTGPYEIERFVIESSTTDCPAADPPNYSEQLADFNVKLDALKEEFKPFLENHVPEATIPRRKLYLDHFDFRYEDEKDRSNFSRLLEGDGQWENVAIPDYRGPVGKWTCYYRRVFEYSLQDKLKRVFIHFEGVDYTAKVYINGRCVGTHEGFFAPFEFDITDFLIPSGGNVLLVEVQNDAPTIGLESWSKEKIDGDKIYAASGPGWDDPELGWHHCPPGAGIYNRVYLEERPTVFVSTLFVRPNIDEATIEARMEVHNCDNSNREFSLNLSVFPANFEGEGVAGIDAETRPAGPGINFYRLVIPMGRFRSWNPATPWLYVLRAKITLDGSTEDEKDCRFGMRTFRMDENGEEDSQRLKGTLLLNGKPVILRGANTMGHLQQCVMESDYTQLIEDILIAKLANMSFFRFTQRPLQEEVYAYCDMLGMMNQTDLPLFGWIRRNQFTEGVRQSGEMERLIRSHPSSIMVTFVNEPFDSRRDKREHRDLLRNEMEDFFVACTQAVRLENPDRVIKHVEGDYDPPTETGLSDFHTYNMWYTNHALSIGELHKGYLPAVLQGWKTSCGEYGTEGLDPLEVMMEDYPEEWTPNSIDDRWNPVDIPQAQTYSMHGDWFEEQSTITDWIREGQEHQRVATKLMTEALRRRADIIVSTAVHLLIDAWPSGWMKTLVDHRRKPKPAYFAYQAALEPVKINLRTDRFSLYSGDTARVETWVFNDLGDAQTDCIVTVTVRAGEGTLVSFQENVDVAASSSAYTGHVEFEVPSQDTERSSISIDAELRSSSNDVFSREQLTIQIYRKRKTSTEPILFVGGTSKSSLESAGLALQDYSPDLDPGTTQTHFIIIDSVDRFTKHSKRILSLVGNGSRALLLLHDNQGASFDIDGRDVKVEKMNGLTFLARSKESTLTRSLGPKDFSFFYNGIEDRIDYLADSYVHAPDLTPILFTYKKPAFGKQTRNKKDLLSVVGSMPYGKGMLHLSTLRLAGFTGKNPVIDFFLRDLCAGSAGPD